MNNIEKGVPIFRHLEDEDNLLENRDGPIAEGQELIAEQLASTIYTEYITDECKALFIICSTKKRSLETAEMISSYLKKLDSNLKVLITKDPSLREIDQGKVILPADYNVGDKFEGLLLAGNIFFKEVFGGDKEGGQDNYSYRYSDPLLQDDGTYKYPELKEFFSEPGESYKDILVRLYEQVISFAGKAGRFNEKIKFVICSHGQTAQIFQDLVEASNLFKEKEINIKQGALPRLCWELFKKRTKQRLDLGEFDFLSMDHIFNEEMIQILKREVDFLKAN
jgi:broad specificity phosphatase PhoE